MCSRTSGLSIRPVRNSQYLIGAGLGSANNRGGRWKTDCHAASAPGPSLSRSNASTAAKVPVATCAEAIMPPLAPSISMECSRASSPVSTAKPGGLRLSNSRDCAMSAERSFTPTMLGWAAPARIDRRPDLLGNETHETLGFLFVEGHSLAGRGGEDQAVDRFADVVPHQPAHRIFVEHAIAKRRDQRQPEAGGCLLCRTRDLTMTPSIVAGSNLILRCSTGRDDSGRPARGTSSRSRTLCSLYSRCQHS
jgi:hypothetical protein